MSSLNSQETLVNGHTRSKDKWVVYTTELQDAVEPSTKKTSHSMLGPKHAELPQFHGDALLGDKHIEPTGLWNDLRKVFTAANAEQITQVALKKLSGQGLDMVAGSKLVGSLPSTSAVRQTFIESSVMEKYNKMLHPPLTYLGDAFQYRTADGKFNSALHPHLGQAGAPYAKTVPSKTHVLGAQPDPSDIFDRLMARDEKGRESKSGLSSMLIYHATIIIHDIFRTNELDNNISDSSSYLDLSPLYGYTMEMQRKVRDDRYKLGLLKPDTFAEDRLLRQPPGVCIYLVMYNRYHNYAATQLRRINENGRFSVPAIYSADKPLAIVEGCILAAEENKELRSFVQEYKSAWHKSKSGDKKVPGERYAPSKLQDIIDKSKKESKLKNSIEEFELAYDAAWDKLDDDLFNTARLITCGMYVNISIHDYLRALMGFHQYDTTFTLDPRIAINEHNKSDPVSRGIGNQVTTEFNLLYRFHCAISLKDEAYTEAFMRQTIGPYFGPDWDPKTLQLRQYLGMRKATPSSNVEKPEPCKVTFGLRNDDDTNFTRSTITGLFDDQKMINQLIKAMDDPISKFGPRNVPRCLKAIEIMGILQGRKWEIGTLNDFRDFFGLKRHTDFSSISKNTEIQDALRDLYDHPDKVELYPGIFCEGDEDMGLDPGPGEVDSALWSAIFSDAITLVRSDRFYTVDWNTNSLTSWGMKEVTPDVDTLKSSVFHRLIQRAFPEWFPYDSVRFFHPFYTAETNARYAQAQGYAKEFKFDADVLKRDIWGNPTDSKFHIDSSNPIKPKKPVYLTNHDDIQAILKNPNTFVNPVCLHQSWLPAKVAAVLDPARRKHESRLNIDILKIDDKMILEYFTSVLRAIVRREVIAVNQEKSVFQLDATRDLAIPVVTRYVADFLGFSHLLRTEINLTGKYSENEIYQHITNCQVFLAYNVDETKLLKRRKVFQESMQFLFKLAENGNAKEANRFWITKGFFAFNDAGDTDVASKQMRMLGQTVAQRVLAAEKDVGNAAAVLLLIALDGAYNSVLAFSSVLNYYLEGLRNYAEAKDKDLPQMAAVSNCEWLQVQKLSLEDTTASTDKIKNLVLEAQLQSVRLPIVRKVAEDFVFKDGAGNGIYKKGDTVICDIHEAFQGISKSETKHGDVASQDDQESKAEYDYLKYTSSLSENYAHFNARAVGLLGLTAMIKVLGQMKNLRRGHDTQGKLKKVNIDQTYEGYANFMAPKRMKQIQKDYEQALKEGTLEERDKNIFTSKVLKPKIDTYLTPEWDEMIPFPTTWKIRFDGYGSSLYDFSTLYVSQIPEDPLYQPQGASHVGGSFAETVCVCNLPGNECKCRTGTSESSKEAGPALLAPQRAVSSGGCGVPGSDFEISA